MNKYQEALNTIMCETCHIGEVGKPIQVIKELLERETPMKPIPRFTTHQTIKWWACPICDTELLFENQGCRNNDCRQKIDWSNDNE